MANSGEPFTEWLVGNIDQPVRVENIYIQGLQKTKIDFIANIFKAVATSANVRDLYANSNFVMERINGLGIFKETELAFFEGSEPGSTNVQFTAQEKKNRSFSIKKEFGADGSSVVVNGGVGNLFGRAEELDCHFKMASKTHFSFGTTFKKPFVTTQKTYQMELESFKEIRDCTEHSRYHEDAQGAVIRMLFPFKGLFHTFSYENLWREISGLPNGTPSKVRDHSGHFLKGSLRHQVTLSNLDTVIFPTAGHSINLQNEVAGIGGNVDYFKHEFTGTKYFKIVDRLVLSIGLGAGMMYSMRGSQLPLSDRFYLGGPSSLKGFAQKSIGERQESNFHNLFPLIIIHDIIQTHPMSLLWCALSL
eukprot:TRINITY_DN3240_c0_g2_i2.p1 TRINITY_DN3240_c0_g2~~TRINITY_DN3240_c0_g2_i2.p1  ORF type:complete len:362 (-),score=72.42 TRINITY_DN3240_c0_g2_i2:49-1134(-)